ncbi:hypothetical protein BDN72DRAFT_899991 [Pluteus cervinus]|uniref:Uncharacterized protein n=1 Tax=Pluteus cervinus TaxID=181527 RepID=A0ACD3AL69_9AGAR|nr:hypothetical protein BDN72DRAFT_899991 [Pluteus cervinus]
MPRSPQRAPRPKEKENAATNDTLPPPAPVQGTSASNPPPPPSEPAKRYTLRSTAPKRSVVPASSQPPHKPRNQKAAQRKPATSPQPLETPQDSNPVNDPAQLAPTTPTNNTPNRQANNLKPVEPTPPTKKAAAMLSFVQNQPQQEVRRAEAREELSGHIVGPMPPKDFLDEFLPAKNLRKSNNPPKIKADVFKKMSKVSTELPMYEEWIKALEPYCGKNIVQVDSHAHVAFDQDGHKFGPDITTYYDVPEDDRPEKCTLTQADMLLEFKFHTSDDPFDDDSDNFERATEGGKKTLGQITVYATAQLARQFRTHVFSILVFPKYARLLRWDRSGVVVTGKIDLLNTKVIPEFFLRLQRATPRFRGVDGTVRPANLTPEQDQEVRAALGAESDTVLLEMTVSGRKFITADSVFFGASSPLGRATRCFRAYDLKKKKSHILKDSWRIYTRSRKPEHKIYDKLRRKKVPHIPKVEIGGDLDPSGRTHQTITQNYDREPWSKAKNRLRTFRHYRIVLQRLHGHLSSCRNIKDVVIAVRDAAEAEALAAEDALVVHRDVSYANIMVNYDENGNVEGFLIDWDMCKELDVDYGDADCTPERTGTWYFIAARLIAWGINPMPVQSRIDDVESLFHVLIYLASHFTDHGLNNNHILGGFVNNYFRTVAIQDGRSCGGQGKMTFFRASGAGIVENIKNVRLRGLIKALIPPLATRYALQDIRDSDDENGNPIQIFLDFPQEHYDNAKLLDDPKWFAKTLTMYINKAGWEKNGELVPQTVPAGPAMQASNTLSLATSAISHQDPSLAILEKRLAQKRKGDQAEVAQETVATPGTRGEPSKKRRKVNTKRR